jgi:hypothetical protein
MTMLHTLRPSYTLLALIAFCVPSVLPRLSAQTPKELMTAACDNEIRQRKQNTLWASHVERRITGHVYREREIDTVDGPVHLLLSVDGHDPSPSELKQDNDRLRDLRENPKARLTLRKNREPEEKKVDDLLHVIPDIFLFEDQGPQEGLERLTFVPNPAYRPETYEETALHAMSGLVLTIFGRNDLLDFQGP